MSLNRNNLSLSFGILLALAGCGDSGDGSVGRQKERLTGRVDGAGSFEGSTVDAHEVSSDGQPVPESNPSTQGSVDASGHYSVEVNAASSVEATYVVETTTGATRRAAIVETDFTAGGDVVVEPLTAETTFESDVFVRALADGSLCDGCSSALVLDFVGEGAASAYAASPTAASLDASADVTATAVEAFHASIVASTDQGKAKLDAAFEAHLEARALRAAALDSATTEAQVDSTEAAYLDDVVAAYVTAGIDLDEQATAAQIAAENANAHLDAVASLDASLEAALRADVEVQRAALVTLAIEGHAQVTGTAEVALATAGDTLRTSLHAAASAGASADAQIDAAWDAYRVSVRASLRATLEPAQQVAFDAAVSALESASVTLHTTLDTTFSVTGNIATWITPALTFSLSGDAQVQALVNAGANQAKAAAMVKVLLSLDLAAAASAG